MRYLSLAVSMIALGLCFTACSDDNETVGLPEVIDFQNLSMSMTADHWSYCYDELVGAVKVDGFLFSHSASSFDFDGTVYDEWSGFCPSRVNDTEDYPDDWVDHQWACMSPNPYGGIYMVGNSGSQVSSDPLSNTTCSLEMVNHGFFRPSFVYINNSSYTYYCAKNGSQFNDAFGSGDNLVLNVVGVRNGAMTAQLKLPLIQNDSYLTQWTGVSLEQLGVVDKILFYVDSTSKGVFGLNVPSYFCIADFGYYLVEDLN